MTIKVHWVPPAQRFGGRKIRTSCGKNGMQCRGFAPLPNHPGEYDDDWCNRFEATPFKDDVTCKTCKRAADRAAWEEERR